MKFDEILKICDSKFKYLNYSDRTKETYISYIKKFLISTNKYSQHLVSSDFQNYLNNYDFSSVSQQNQIINAINVILRGYDIPLQGSTTNTCDHMTPVLPTPDKIKKSGYFEKF